MLLDMMGLRPRPRKPELPRWFFRRMLNRKYPTPHQGQREKERRLKNVALGRTQPDQFRTHEDYLLAQKRGEMLLNLDVAAQFAA